MATIATVDPWSASQSATSAGSRDRMVHWIKWTASITQILGYGLTAFGATPLNLYCFLLGLIGWFAVGIFWRDRAIMLMHVVALGALVLGMLSAA